MTCYRYALYAFQLIELFKEQRSFFFRANGKYHFSVQLIWPEISRNNRIWSIEYSSGRKISKDMYMYVRSSVVQQYAIYRFKNSFFFFSVHVYIFFLLFLKFDLPKSNLNWHTYMVWQKRILFKSFVSI